MQTNEITVNLQDILNLPDNSVTDAETCRQIGLMTTGFLKISDKTAYDLCRKIKRGYEINAMYPHVAQKLTV